MEAKPKLGELVERLELQMKELRSRRDRFGELLPEILPSLRPNSQRRDKSESFEKP